MRKGVLSGSTLLVLVAGYFCYISFRRNAQPPLVTFSQPTSEIDPKFLITEDNGIVFSANNSDHFTFYRFDSRGVQVLDSSLKNVFNPFLFAGRICGLQDNDGDEKYFPIDTNLNIYTKAEPVQAIFSFNNGYLITFKLANDGNVYLVDHKTKTKKILIKNVKRLHNVCFSEARNFIVINYDDNLSYINLYNNEVLHLASNAQREGMNPFIYDNDVYFSNNSDSEYHRLFKIDLRDQSLEPELLYYSDFDVRMPKYDGKDLYFIEIVNSEYLLRKVNLKTKTIRDITQKGVVYSYDFYKNGVAFSFYDFDTPKSLFSYNESNDSLTNLSGTDLALGLSCQLIKKSEDRSSAYIFIPSEKSPLKGVVLYFHAGLHSDFSPGWDNILMNICNNGYIIVCPNYPMSSGFGKSYYNSDTAAAVSDITNWKKYVRLNYQNLPIFYLSSSSGNILMERCLTTDNKEVVASVSMFGVAAEYQPVPSIPNLYILGENDPIVDFAYRSMTLRVAKKFEKNITVISYPEEGHWFRKQTNIKDAIGQILSFFYKHS